VVTTLVLYWLAHSYADLAGERLRSGGRLTSRGLLATMLRELPILIGAAIPLATLLPCWIAGTGYPPPSSRRCGPRPASSWPIELAAGLRGRLKGRQLLAQNRRRRVARIVDHPPQGVLH
jgi:hypothetical protein